MVLQRRRTRRKGNRGGSLRDRKRLAVGSILRTFRTAQDGSFRNSTLDERRSVLVNALCILCGAAAGNEAEQLAEKLADPNNGWTPATLSMVCFQYDALLKVNKEKFRSFVLADIDANASDEILTDVVRMAHELEIMHR